MSKEKSGIYSITNTINGKKYIGRSKCIYKRWERHRTTLKNNKDAVNRYLQNAYNKYGKDSFEFEIIEEVIENIEKRELYYIKEFKTYQCEFGYNIVCDSGGYVKYKKSEKDLLNTCNITNKNKTKIYQIDNSNIVVKIWDCLQDIADYYNVSYKKARKFLFGEYLWNGKKKIVKDGFFWVKENEYDTTFNYMKYFKQRPAIRKDRKERLINLLIIDRDNTIIAKVSSYTEAALFLGVDRTRISEIVTKKIKINKYRVIKEKDYTEPIKFTKEREIGNPISLQNIETQEIRHFTSHRQASTELGFKIIHLVRGYKTKGDKVAKITQWRGWKIYNPL
jgi:hypothetical protein